MPPFLCLSSTPLSALFVFFAYIKLQQHTVVPRYRFCVCCQQRNHANTTSHDISTRSSSSSLQATSRKATVTTNLSPTVMCVSCGAAMVLYRRAHRHFFESPVGARYVRRDPVDLVFCGIFGDSVSSTIARGSRSLVLPAKKHLRAGFMISKHTRFSLCCMLLFIWAASEFPVTFGTGALSRHLKINAQNPLPLSATSTSNSIDFCHPLSKDKPTTET